MRGSCGNRSSPHPWFPAVSTAMNRTGRLDGDKVRLLACHAASVGALLWTSTNVHSVLTWTDGSVLVLRIR